MKHIENFENFDINEWFGQELVTGYGHGEKEIAKKRIEDEIESAIEEYRENPEDFIEYDEDELREELLQSAIENGYRGEVIVEQSADDPRAAHANKYFIIYRPKNTPLQDIGSSAAGELKRR